MAKLGVTKKILGAVIGLCLGALGATSAVAALDVSMSIAPTYINPINSGDITAFRITLANSNPASSVTGIAFTDTLPIGLKVAGTGLVTYSCVDGFGTLIGPTGSVTATVGSGSISLSGGTVPVAAGGGASGRCDIDVEVTSTARGTVQTNTIAAGAVTGTDTGPISNGTQAVQTVTINNLNRPVISKSFSSATVVKDDQTVTLTLTISNANNPGVDLPLNGAADTPAFGLRDILPAGLEVAAVPNTSVSCPGGIAPNFIPSAGDTTLLAVGGKVAAGGSCTFRVDIVGTTTAGAYSNSLTNIVNASSDFATPRGINPASNASATLAVQSALQVSKSFSPGTAAAGQSAVLTIVLRNVSPSRALTFTTFTDDPIDGIGNAGYGLKVGSPATTCVGGVVAATAGSLGIALTGGTLAANSSCTISVPFVGTLQASGTPQSFTNTIPEGAVQTSDPSIISQTAVASVNLVDQLTVSKTVSPNGSVAPGNPVQYTITINNYAAVPLTSVTFTDTLPAGMTALASVPAPPALSGAGCIGLTDTVASAPAAPTFTIGNMPAGTGPNPGTCTITFWAMTPSGGAPGLVLTNQIPGGAVVGNSGGGSVSNANGSGAANATVTNVMTVNKSFSPSSAFEGTISQLTLVFTNLSAQPITAASITDTLPLVGGQQLVIANPATASTTCVGGSVTAVPGASTVSLSGATIPARAGNGTGASGTCTLTVSVVGGAGSYVNTLASGALTGTEVYANNATHTAVSPGPVSASLTYSSALTSQKSFSPTTISSGGMSTVTIQLGNVGTGTLNNVSVTDPLPSGMTIASPAGAYTTCGGAPVITATPGAATATMTGAIIPASGQCNLLFNVIATGGGNWVNTIPAGNISATGGVRNVSAVTSTLINSTAGGVTVTNNTSPNSLTSPGQISVLTINISNGGTIALSGLGLTDYFTTDGTSSGGVTGMIVGPTPGATTTCPGGVVTAASGGTTVSLAGANLAPGANCLVNVNVTLITTGTVQNRLPVGVVTTDQGITNTLASATSLSAGSNIGVTKVFSPAVVKPGDRSRLKITLINPLALSVSAISLIDDLPGGLVIPAAANPSTTCSGATVSAPTTTRVSMTGGSLPPASNGVASICIAEIDVLAAAAGSYLNTIPIGNVTGTVGGGPVSNPEPASATLQARDPVGITKAFSPTAVGLGAPTTVTITLTNPNTVPLTGAVLSDALPANLSVALTPNASTTCVGGTVTAPASATTVVLTGGTIPASGSCLIRFDALSNTAGVYVNTIPAGALATNQGVTNENPATATVRIINPPSVNKQFSPAAIPAGGTSTLTIVLGNTNSTPATLQSALIDALPTSPAPILVASPNGVGGTCTTASVTAIAGSGTVTYASGATIPAGGCSIVVTVTGAVDGVFTNTIPVGALHTDQGDNIQSAIADLTISPLGYISGKIFKDNNVAPNGLFDAGLDTPITGVTVNLTGTDYGADGVLGGGDDSAVNRSTTTDGLGNYVFLGLNPGSYTVTEPTQPAGTFNGVTTAGFVSGGGGGAAGTATVVATTPSSVSNIILLKNGASQVAGSPGNNFAEVQTSGIGGSVFLDQNDNGVRNASDTAIAGVTIELFNGGASPIATTVTDGAGNYLFSGLAPGSYSVREPSQPVGTANGKTLSGPVPNGGTAGNPTAQNVVPSQIAGITLPPGTTALANVFAEVPAGRQVNGRVFIDANDDGVFNGADSGLAGVTLTLTGLDFNNVAVTASVVTTFDGRYVFTGLAAGTYTVTEPAQPPGTTNGTTTFGSTGGLATLVAVVPSAISSIDLTGANTISSSNDFAEIAVPITTGTISGNVYADHNDNGLLEAGEPGIGGVTVTLTGVDVNGAPVNFTTVTDGQGAYIFTGVPASGAGGYQITEIQPSFNADGKTTVSGNNPGFPPSGKPIVSGGTDIITGVTLAAGAVQAGYNFGEIGGTASVAGYVYADSNNNGVRDAGEIGISGVLVRLIGSSAAGGAVNQSQTTGADGSFLFTGVPASGASGYSLIEVQPAGVTDGKTGVAPGAPGTANSHKPVGVGDDDRIIGIVVGQNSTLVDYKYGEIPVPQLKPPIINGYVYLDRNHTRVRPTDGSLSGQAGWTVVLRQNGVVICTTTTDQAGFYQFDNLHCPGYEASGLPVGPGYSITFSKDGNSLPAVPVSGGNRGVVPPSGGQITTITLADADRVIEQNLPLDPAGVVYNSLTRQPVSGAQVTISGPPGFDPITHLVGGLGAASQLTGSDGWYQFLLQNNFPSGVYRLVVTAPTGYLPAPSAVLPACSSTLNVGANPNPALIQASDAAPAQSVTEQLNPTTCQGLVPGGSATTQYYLTFTITNGGSAPILNNHIPLDPLISGTIVVTKVSPKVWASRGDLVPYTITATDVSTSPLAGVSIRDILPPGFKFRVGSATRNGQPVTPIVSGGDLIWPAESFAAKEKKTYTVLLIVGSGVGDGDYVNRAWAGIGGGGAIASNTATATVRITPDPTLDCPDVIGKVFDDKNANGYQDQGEPGIPAVRLATVNGLLVTTDSEGRFHVPCPAIPNPDRGSNFVMKLDNRSLPSGFRVTTENPRDVRLTRGKVVKLNFGATLHRVVRIELTDGAFKVDTLELLDAWKAQIDALPEQLKARPSVVRIAYARNPASPALAKHRSEEIRKLLDNGWRRTKGQYTLIIEIEGEK